MANLSYIQSVTTQSAAGANGAASFTSATKGNLLVTMCFQSVPGGLGGTPTMSIADTPNGGSTNAWTKVWANVGTLGLGNGGWYQAWVCINSATGADTITVTPSVVTGRFTKLENRAERQEWWTKAHTLALVALPPAVHKLLLHWGLFN